MLIEMPGGTTVTVNGLRGGVNRRAGARKGRGYRPAAGGATVQRQRDVCDDLLCVTSAVSSRFVQLLSKPMPVSSVDTSIV